MVDLHQQMDTPQYKTDHHLGNKVVLRQVINHLDFLQHKAGLHMVDPHQQMDTPQYKTDFCELYAGDYKQTVLRGCICGMFTCIALH